jgi:hypothetical protein
VKLHEMQLRRARAFGNCWLGGELWRQLRMEEFWEEQLAGAVPRETVPWEKVLRLLVVNRPSPFRSSTNERAPNAASPPERASLRARRIRLRRSTRKPKKSQRTISMAFTIGASTC